MTEIPFPSWDLMPIDVIDTLIEQSDWKLVLKLRQVSSSIKDLVDHSHSLPDAKFRVISMDLHENEKNVEIYLYGCEKHYRIHYKIISENMCSRQVNGKEAILFENTDMVDLAMKDLKQVLRFQNSTLKSLQFALRSKDSIKLQKVLKSKLIKTEKLQIKYHRGGQIMLVLPFLNLNSLRNVQLNPYRESFSNNIMSAEDMNALKNILSNSPKLVSIESGVSPEYSIQETLPSWGPFFEELEAKYWYFRIANRDEILRVKSDYCQIRIDRIPLDQVPENAVVREN